jgi:hypothetical protein
MSSLIDKCKACTELLREQYGLGQSWRCADCQSEEARLKAELEQSGYTVVTGLGGKVLAFY